MSTSITPTFPLFTATYTSPTNAPFTHTHQLPSLPTQSTAEKTAYLSTLRKAREELQDKINQELTKRMEEDIARVEAAVGSGGSAKGVDEGKEEENYGEEVVDED